MVSEKSAVTGKSTRHTYQNDILSMKSTISDLDEEKKESASTNPHSALRNDHKSKDG
jgi:hypothetical protein